MVFALALTVDLRASSSVLRASTYAGAVLSAADYDEHLKAIKGAMNSVCRECHATPDF